MSDTLPLLPGLRRRLLSPFLKSLPPYSWKPAYKPFVPVHDPKPGSPAHGTQAFSFPVPAPDQKDSRSPWRPPSQENPYKRQRTASGPPEPDPASRQEAPAPETVPASSGQKTLPLTFDATRGCPRDRRWCREALRRNRRSALWRSSPAPKGGHCKAPRPPRPSVRLTRRHSRNTALIPYGSSSLRDFRAPAPKRRPIF